LDEGRTATAAAATPSTSTWPAATATGSAARRSWCWAANGGRQRGCAPRSAAATGIFSGNVGDTTASFNGGNPFTLAAENDKGGWYTAGFAIKGGSEYSYLAIEGDIDFRAGEQRYDLRIAGRSIF